MKFSIIVPIYNVEKYLCKCIDSIINQTYKNIEIILVDDGSPDNCSAICDYYATKDSRITVIHKKNGGLSDARNIGLSYAKGDYIIFLDGDDYIDLDSCERFLEKASRGYDILIGDAYVEGGSIDLGHIKTQKVMSGEEYLLYAFRAHKAPMATWLNVYRREFLLNNCLSFQYGILHEDEEFTPRVFLKAKSIVYTNILFYHYVIRENSITTKIDKRKNATDLYATCCRLENIYNNLDNSELKFWLLDSLSEKYLSLFQIGKLFQYGNQFLHKEFVMKNAKTRKNILKANLYVFSPRMYYYVNLLLKKLL